MFSLTGENSGSIAPNSGVAWNADDPKDDKNEDTLLFLK